MYVFLKRFVSLAGIISLTACGSSGMVYAPVSDRYYQSADTWSYYTVSEGDSLYSIAWAFGLDYRDLAAANGLSKPYHMALGKRLQVRSIRALRHAPQVISGSASRIVEGGNQGSGQLHLEKVEPKQAHQQAQEPSQKAAKVAEIKTSKKEVERPAAPIQAQTKHEEMPVALPVAPSTTAWVWPTKGKVVSRFIPTSVSGNKGIEIQGILGQPVRAAAAGKVVYSGSGVRGYGNLIIIKHNQNYLSAYAYNQRLLVKEGDNVTGGQAIAEMGKAETGKVLLHFEIRYNGQPVDPMAYLK